MPDSGQAKKENRMDILLNEAISKELAGDENCRYKHLGNGLVIIGGDHDTQRATLLARIKYKLQSNLDARLVITAMMQLSSGQLLVNFEKAGLP